MAPSIVDHSVAPPGYSSQRDGTSPLHPPDSPTIESADDLVSSQTHQRPGVFSITSHSAQATPRNSDVQFNEGSPALQRSRTAASRRRYTSLPYGGSTVTFPVHLAYQPGDVTSTADAEVSELELPVPGHPSVQQLHEKLASGAPASRGPTIRLNPANYILLSRKGTPKPFLTFNRTSASIKGKFTVNPYLHVPAALLAPVPVPSGRDREGTEGARKNLKLEVENGGIDAEIFLVGEPDQHLDSEPAILRTSLDLKIRSVASPRSKKNKFPLIAKIVSKKGLV